MAQTAKSGDTVAVHYTGKLDNGDVFDSSEGRDPLSFELGAGNVIPGFEAAVMGLGVGEAADVRIEAKDAYGDIRDDLLVPVSKDRLPDGLEPEAGQQLQVQVAPGQDRVATITDVGDENVTLDLNHPLAGKDLSFHIELVEIK